MTDDEIPDWFELCSYIDEQHQEFELTEMQYCIVVALLGLNQDEPHTDDYLQEVLLPAIVKTMQSL